MTMTFDLHVLKSYTLSYMKNIEKIGRGKLRES